MDELGTKIQKVVRWRLSGINNEHSHEIVASGGDEDV